MKFQKLLCMGVFALVLGGILAPTPSFAATKEEAYIKKIEKMMLLSSTKKIQYCAGRISPNRRIAGKGVKKISLSASKLQIKKKGWYTIRVTTHKKTNKQFYVKLKKKTYKFSINTAVKQKKGYYYVVSKSNTALALGSSAVGKYELLEKGDFSYQIWQVESAGGKKFRLKNINTGQYVGGDSGTKAYVLKAFSAGGKYFYIKNETTKEFLQIQDNELVLGKRKNAKLHKFRFLTAKNPGSRAVADDTTTYPTSVNYGSAFSLKGNITSYYSMQSLVAEVLKSDGTIALQKTVSPKAFAYDLKGIDAAMTFGKLAVGNYRYRVRVTDSKGAEITVFDRNFVVYIPSGLAQKTLIYNKTYIEKIGWQSAGSDLDKKACASFALAYCQAIRNGLTPTPQSYWLSLTDVSCVWSKGGYVTAAYGTEQEVLQAAYGQIVAGKPCILHVTGNTSQHWVTVIGYKNVTTGGTLSAANFIAIDPWDGAVITVSDKYKVKTTYRLAYSNS